MTSSRYKIQSLEAEIAITHRVMFESAIELLMLHSVTMYQYDDAIAYLLDILDANNDAYELKMSHVEYLASCAKTRNAIINQVQEKATEKFQIEGTQQNFQTTYEYNYKTIDILVNHLKFSTEDAQIINNKIDEIENINGYQYKLLEKFMTEEFFLLIELIFDKIKTNSNLASHHKKYIAEQAYQEILNQNYNEHTSTARIAREILSKDMLSLLDKFSVEKNPLQRVKMEMKKVKAISRLQNQAREARCTEANVCSKKMKEEVYFRSELIRILDRKFLADNTDQEKFKALEASLATDELACNQYPSFDYSYRTAEQLLLHPLGFFARNVLPDSSKIKDQAITFASWFNTLMIDLTSNCNSEQFLSLYAMGLALPVFNSVYSYLNSSEMDLYLSSANNATLGFGG